MTLGERYCRMKDSSLKLRMAKSIALSQVTGIHGNGFSYEVAEKHGVSMPISRDVFDVIQGHRTLPCAVRMLENEPEVAPRDPPVRFRQAIPTSWLELKLIEGKNRQVRRMTAAVGFPTLRLIRVAIGKLDGTHLAPGAWEILPSGGIARIWQK